MNSITDNLYELIRSKKIKNDVIIWGLDSNTQSIIHILTENGINIFCIVDNFKCDFVTKVDTIKVTDPHEIRNILCNYTILFSVNHLDSLKKQFHVLGINDIFNLRDLASDMWVEEIKYKYSFTDRRKNKRNLCYILAGYEKTIWDTTISRIEAFQSDDFDYCLLSSGKYDKTLEEIAEKNGWSYLFTENNQVCYIQNLVIKLHPSAETIIKMDEDIFIGKDFFTQMTNGFNNVQEHGEYRVGFVVPVIPINCCGYITYLKLIDKFDDFQNKFGKSYRSRFSDIYTEEKALYIWDTISSFDDMVERFSVNEGYNVLDCYYNIGCIMFLRKRWEIMGGWPESANESGMGTDERYLWQNGVDNDMVIYELKNVLAGHLAFRPQKKCMLEYYKENHEKFKIISR